MKLFVVFCSKKLIKTKTSIRNTLSLKAFSASKASQLFFSAIVGRGQSTEEKDLREIGMIIVHGMREFVDSVKNIILMLMIIC